jgi:D-glycero-beta-D-manno-heptose 1-phosphate adenylyltransferase
VNAKIVDLKQLGQRTSMLRSQGMKIVATNGCFDLLHVGHVRFLQAARALGDLLIVGVNGNESTLQLKGPGRPVNDERDRTEVVAALGCIDLVSIFPQVRATEFLRAAHPLIYVKGGDYSPETLNAEEAALLKEIGAAIRIISFEQGYSTTRLINKLCKGHA